MSQACWLFSLAFDIISDQNDLMINMQPSLPLAFPIEKDAGHSHIVDSAADVAGQLHTAVSLETHMFHANRYHL